MAHNARALPSVAVGNPVMKVADAALVCVVCRVAAPAIVHASRSVCANTQNISQPSLGSSAPTIW